MKQQEPTHVTQQLQDVPAGGLTIVRNSPSGQEYVLLTGQFSAKTVGKGKIEAYHVFPGVDASYNLLSAAEITVHHAASSSVLELFYCRNGRVGWNMRGGTAVYLGAGDLTAHSSACCADSAMMFPLGYAEGNSHPNPSELSNCYQLPCAYFCLCGASPAHCLVLARSLW